ncbi:MAG TPA: CAP domain-containing protein [Candidatus Levybacteria bacterium]|mgnify:CR=1 FL=1|nr:CAP domain-containing protein [Candidatus Levybacteria bacterium]
MRRVTKHYFIPHEHNNFRSKLLHHSSLLVLIFFLFFTSISVHVVQQQKPEILGVAYSINQQELLEYTNNARKERGLEPLTLNESLVSAANGKAQHMFSNNYWAHFAPDGTSPWQFIKGAGYQYIFAGENLAKGFTDSKSVVDAWLNSPSHRDNLLSDKYKEIGFAVSEGQIEGVETVLVVQMFGAQDVPAPTESTVAFVQDTLPPTPAQPLSTPFITLAPTAVPASRTAVITNQEIEYKTHPVVVAQAPRTIITPSFLQISAENNPFVNLSSATRAIPIIVIGSLLLALTLDFIIIKRKNIPRIVGHNLDHIMILGMFLLLLLLQRFGSIL